jgi:class 3 adenylate cyclase
MADLPSVTVTFLFTDIEGSTALWERDRVAMRLAVDRHFRLIREATTAHDEVLIKIIGDAGKAAFPTAPDAVAAVNGAPKRATRLWAADDQLRRHLGADASQASREAHARFVRSLTERLESERFAEAWAADQGLTLDYVQDCGEERLAARDG